MNLIESYQSNRLVDRLHAVAQFILVFLILAAVNTIAMRNYKRIDTTLGRDFTLSAQTVAYLAQIEQPIKVVVTLSDQDNDLGIRDIFYDVKSLLNEYEYETRNNGTNRIQVEYIDIYKQASKAKELGIDQEDSIIFLSGPQTKRVIPINKLYHMVNNELHEFLGESVFTQSVLEVSQKNPPHIYFTSGHGELDLQNFTSGQGISRLQDELKSRNIKVSTLNLASQNKVPENASLLIIPGPKTRFLPQEQELLKTYLRRSSGRLLVLLEPGDQHGLDDLLFDWGILTDNAIAVETDRASVINGGDLMIRRYSSHAITDELLEMGLHITTDRARVVREDPGRPIDDSLIVTELMETSSQSWGEKNYATEETPTYDPAIDLVGPIRVGAISERKVDSSLGISIPGGRLTVIGSSNFITNNRIQASGNLFLVLNAINYAIDRVAQLNIPPRPIRKVKLDLSIEQLLISRYLIWFGPPLVVGFFGLIVYLARRQ
ncbi:MAG: GldG family protein [Opitutaceae bacterium]|nr:GldG family protein [Opitutaceae bacterium]